MTITVNGSTHPLTKACSLTAFISELLDSDPAKKSVAIAVNGEVIPRSLWETHILKADDVLEVVRPVAGG